MGCGQTPTPGWLNFDNSFSLRLALDFSYFDELLTASGFSQVIEMSEGHSKLYGENVVPYQTPDVPQLPYSLYIEAFR